MAAIETRRGRFGALAAGPDEGPLVICLHGFPDDATTFRRLQADLADAGLRSLAVFLRGYRPSPVEGPYALGELVDDLFSLLDVVAPRESVHVIGHDYGAQIAYAAIGREPRRFARAVTLAGPHPDAVLRNARRHPRQWLMSRYIAFFQLRGIAERRVSRDQFAYIERLWRRWSPGFEPPEDHLRRVKATISASMPAPIAMYRAGGFDIGADPIPVPTLNLLGERDGCLLPALAAGQERLFTGPYELAVLPGAGHFLHHEQPARVSRKVLGWLSAPA